MPILKQEQDIWPLDLLGSDLISASTNSEAEEQTEVLERGRPDLMQFGEADDSVHEDPDNPNNWWALYTLARFEKKLMRQLLEEQIPFFGPTIACRRRSPQGRVRTTYEPLFPNYVFIRGSQETRYDATCTGSVSRWMPVPNPLELVTDLRQIRQLILTGAPLSPERRLEAGQKVRIKSGIFKGFEGAILRREKEVRLLVYVRYMGQGASVVLDDCQLEAI